MGEGNEKDALKLYYFWKDLHLFLCCFFIFNSLPFYVVSLVEIVSTFEKKS